MDISLKTMQPYLVLDTEKFHQAVYMQDGISHFYTFVPTKIDNIIFVPNGCMDIIFEYSDTEMNAYIQGTMISGSDIFYCNEKRYFGVRFKNGYLPIFIQASVKELIEKKTKLNDIMKEKNYFSVLEDKRDFKSQIENFLFLYYRLYYKKDLILSKYATVKQCKEMIYLSKGSIKVNEIEENIGYSARYINKLFESEIGYSPKTFCKIVRFQNILFHLIQNPNNKLVEVAMKYGYYDQAQMNKEFKKLANKTPTEYINLLKETNYRQRVVDVPIFTRNNDIKLV
ncbi:MAG: helix-turn-helix transcriptional regulator [Clostridia bacterium]